MKKLNQEEIKKNGVFIQGDVVLFKTNQKPKELKPKKDGVIAEGEVTGHAHRVDPKEVALMTNPDMPALVWLKSLGVNPEAKVTHEEHESINLKSDDYVSWGQEEYDWVEGLRRVAD